MAQPAPIDQSQLDERIAAYRAATGDFLALARSLGPSELDRQPPDPDDWTPRKVIHHLADAESEAYLRLCRLLAEPQGSPILGFDEAHWARVLPYDRPVQGSLALIEAVRGASAELLDTITVEDLGRSGLHSVTGDFSLRLWVAVYRRHPIEHAKQIRDVLAGS